MLDPSCGDGRFIALHPNSVGIEQNPQSAHHAIESAPTALVHEGDFFAWAGQTDLFAPKALLDAIANGHS